MVWRSNRLCSILTIVLFPRIRLATITMLPSKSWPSMRNLTQLRCYLWHHELFQKQQLGYKTFIHKIPWVQLAEVVQTEGALTTVAVQWVVEVQWQGTRSKTRHPIHLQMRRSFSANDCLCQSWCIAGTSLWLDNIHWITWSLYHQHLIHQPSPTKR